MNTLKKIEKTEEAKNYVKQLLWDYEISEDEFLSMLDGEAKDGVFDRLWAEKRAIEGLGYYEILDLIGIERIARDWNKLKPSIRNKTRVKGIDYVLRRYNISAAG